MFCYMFWNKHLARAREKNRRAPRRSVRTGCAAGVARRPPRRGVLATGVSHFKKVRELEEMADYLLAEVLV
jgi:hypothetical protein